jgi:protein SCO1/2
MRAIPLLLALLIPALAFAKEHPVLPSQAPAETGASVYLLDGQYTDQDGKAVRLEDFRGEPILISMFYATCPHACPLLINDIKRVERAVPKDLRGKMKVVLVTFDPDRDTEAKLRELRDAHRVDTSRWSFLRTDAETVRELAAVLGIRYRFGKDGSIGHSSVITALDADGKIAGRIDGLRQPHDGLVEKLGGMLESCN